MKTCTKCKAEKPIVGFSKHKNGKNGLRSWCKTCDAAYHAADYAAAPEKPRARAAAAYAANPEKFAGRSAAWYAGNREEIATRNAADRAACPEKFAARTAASQKAHPGKYNARNAKRRATKLQATPAWADKEKIEGFYYTADMLGMHTGGFYHVDHTVPLKSKLVCGLHCEFNLQVVTGPENCSKGNRHWPGMP